MFEISELGLMEDRETGELQYDQETGELNMCPVMRTWCIQKRNEETGEYEHESGHPGVHHNKKVFQVPRSALSAPGRRSTRRPPSRVTVVSAEHRAEESDKASCRHSYATFLPTLVLLLFLPTWATGLCLLAEWVLHAMAHQAGDIHPARTFPLDSPLCYLASSLCAVCQARCAEDRLIQMQDRRKLRAINKRLACLDYVNTVLS